MQHATIGPTLDLCTRYPLWLGGLRQCRMQILLESNPTPSDLSSTSYQLLHVLPEF